MYEALEGSMIAELAFDKERHKGHEPEDRWGITTSSPILVRHAVAAP